MPRPEVNTKLKKVEDTLRMLKFRNNGGQAILSIYRCTWVSGYSTAATTSSKTCNFMADYLINSIGFSEEQALVTSAKVSQLKSTQNPISIVNFFKSNGFDQTKIKTIVIKEPRILSCKVEKTLKPKIKALTDIGLSGSDLPHVLAPCPRFWRTRSVTDYIIPRIELLRSVFGNNEDVICALKNSAWLLNSDNLPDSIDLLKSYGLSSDQIKAFALRKPRYLVSSVKVLETLLIRVEKRLGIPRESRIFIHGIYALGSRSERNLELRIGVYKSFGFTESDVLTLGRKNPYALVLSESKLKNCLNFYLKVLDPAEIVSRPKVLTFSLEKRVIPRYKIWQALKEKGLKINSSLIYILSITDQNFFRRFVLPYKGQVPLCNDYMKRMQSTLEVAK